VDSYGKEGLEIATSSHVRREGDARGSSKVLQEGLDELLLHCIMQTGILFFANVVADLMVTRGRTSAKNGWKWSASTSAKGCDTATNIRVSDWSKAS